MDLIPVRICIEFDDGRYIDMDRRTKGMPADVVNDFSIGLDGDAVHDLKITFPDKWLIKEPNL